MPFISSSPSMDFMYHLFRPLRLTGLIIFLFSSAAVDARIQLPPNVTVPAVFAFGDSIADTGNNNYIPTVIKCDFPPYGKDFMGGRPTGRFCNGRIPSDIIADEVGVKEVVPPYLEPELEAEDLLTGVSFASGGSGFDPVTAKSVLVISLSEQLNLFKDYIKKITALVGEEKAKFIISNSLYIVLAGTNDITVTYFGNPLARTAHYDSNSYTDLLISYASSFVQGLYGLGARRILAFEVPPVGCLPAERTIESFPTRTCASDVNTVSKVFNSKLSAKVKSLRSKLPNSSFVFVDVYNLFLDIILDPEKYGIKEVTRGCCGTGLVEVGVLCNKLDPVSPDVAKYLFWDSVHPTEKAYQILYGERLATYIIDSI